MDNTLIPLMGRGFGPGMFFTFLGLLFVAFLAAKLMRSGRLGPIRYDGPSARGAASARVGTSAPSGRRPGSTPEDDALASLKAKLAAGDITPEEYLARSSVLRRPSTDL